MKKTLNETAVSYKSPAVKEFLISTQGCIASSVTDTPGGTGHGFDFENDNDE